MIKTKKLFFNNNISYFSFSFLYSFAHASFIYSFIFGKTIDVRSNDKKKKKDVFLLKRSIESRPLKALHLFRIELSGRLNEFFSFLLRKRKMIDYLFSPFFSCIECHRNWKLSRTIICNWYLSIEMYARRNPSVQFFSTLTFYSWMQ